MSDWGIKPFFRNLRRQKTIGILSIGSLAISIGVAIAIGWWAWQEFHYDSFHKDADQTFLLNAHCIMNEEEQRLGATYREAGEEAVRLFPEISDMCQVSWTKGKINFQNAIYTEPCLITGLNFFTFFSFPLKSGDPLSCLKSPDAMVIDEYTAARFFPDKDPLGQRLKIGDKEHTVTAVMYNLRADSHLNGHIILPLQEYMPEVGQDAYRTYFKIKNPAMTEKVAKGLTEWIQNVHAIFKQLDYKYSLISLKELRFSPIFQNTADGQPVDIKLVIIFVIVAGVILFIACINFVNLFISTSFLRARMIGIRKTHGAGRGSLMMGFYRETFYYGIVAVLLGIVLAVFLLPEWSPKGISLNFGSPFLYGLLLALVGFVVLVAGTFPAWYMTRFNTIETLKGRFKGKNLLALQKILIIFQFAASITILILILMIHKQVYFMLHKDLGFDKENIVYIEDLHHNISDFQAFCSEMKQHTGIKDVTMKNGLTTEWNDGNSIKLAEAEKNHLMEIVCIQPNYFDLMGMKMLSGDTFDEDRSQAWCILNETAVRLLGNENILGNKILMEGNYFTVRGVVRDAQTKSLHRKMNPQVYLEYGTRSGSHDCTFFKIQGNPGEAIAVIRQTWERLNPGEPFRYHFIDQDYERLYRNETGMAGTLTVAVGIIILISVAGLFAMAFYTTQRRMKEVAIRKINGATLGKLLILLNREFFLWVGIAFLVACPVAWYFVNVILDRFVEHTSLSWWVFVLAGLITVLITLFTVFYQTWKAAHVNPAKLLQND